MKISLNGEPHELASPISLADLLVKLGVDRRLVAVEHNRVVIRRARLEEVTVTEGDEVEIVNFVGGGRI